jgi:nucleotide-binding universal stress UspA family protein
MEFKKILVPIAGNKADAGTVELACNLARQQKSRRTILAVHVIPVGRSLPLDAEVETEVSRAEAILAKVEEQVKKLNCDVEIDILQAREVGAAIVDVAREHQVDLIVIGLTYKTQFGEFCLGDIAPYVLKNAPCRVLLDHQLDTEIEKK